MKILIIAKFWDQSAGIGALRPMKIAKYLSKAGHEVAVVCGREYVKGNSTNLQYIEIPAFSYTGIVAREDAFYKRRNLASAEKKSPSASTGTKSPKKQSLPNRLKWIVYKTAYNSIKTNNTVRFSLCAFKNQLPWEPEIIFSSFAPEEVHFLAMKLKKMYRSAFWIADFRDPMANKLSQSNAEYKYKLRRQKKIFAKADAVTVVSKTWRDEFEKQGAKNAITLYSGFDSTDIENCEKKYGSSNKLVFTYTGSLYPGLSDLRPFFNAIAELIGENKIDSNLIEIVYAGAHAGEFNKQAEILGGKVKIVNHGLVSREESVGLLTQSDILLHALFCFPEARGIITGKLGEYWASGKPIVAIITGSARADEFISILDESGTGISYDATDMAASFAKLKEYIKEQYDRKISGLDLTYSRNDAFIRKFDYSEIVKQLLSILKQRRENN